MPTPLLVTNPPMQISTNVHAAVSRENRNNQRWEIAEDATGSRKNGGEKEGGRIREQPRSGPKLKPFDYCLASISSAAVALPPLTSISVVTSPPFWWNAARVYLPSGRSPLMVNLPSLSDTAKNGFSITLT